MTYLQGVYWDLDGTIANTELEAHLPAFNYAFKDFGLEWYWDKKKYFELLNINGGKNRIHYYSKLNNEYLSDNLIAEIHRRKQNHYLTIIEQNVVELKTGVYRLINELNKKKVRQFIVTSSSKVQVDILLKNLFGDFNPFEFIISSDDVKFVKPHPYPYLKAIQLSGINILNSLVFEDSNAGIKASLGANLPTIYTLSNIPTVLDKKIKLDCIIDSLGDEKELANVVKGPKLEKNIIDYNFLNNYLKKICYAKY